MHVEVKVAGRTVFYNSLVIGSNPLLMLHLLYVSFMDFFLQADVAD